MFTKKYEKAFPETEIKINKKNPNGQTVSAVDSSAVGLT